MAKASVVNSYFFVFFEVVPDDLYHVRDEGGHTMYGTRVGGRAAGGARRASGRRVAGAFHIVFRVLYHHLCRVLFILVIVFRLLFKFPIVLLCAFLFAIFPCSPSTCVLASSYCYSLFSSFSPSSASFDPSCCVALSPRPLDPFLLLSSLIPRLFIFIFPLLFKFTCVPSVRSSSSAFPI